MKKTALVAFGALFLAGAAQAQDKIGFVNLMTVLEGTTEGQATINRLKDEGAAKEAEFKKRMQTLGEKVQQWQSRAKMMKEEKASEEFQALQKEEQDLKMLGMQYQGEFQRKQQEALQEFQKKVQGVVAEVAQREGIAWVVREEMLLFGPQKMDLTTQVIREYDKRFAASKKGK